MSPVPQVRRYEWMSTGWRVKWLWMLTSAWQSATRPGVPSGSAMKVPLAQSAGSSGGLVRVSAGAPPPLARGGVSCASAAVAVSRAVSRAAMMVAGRRAGFMVCPFWLAGSGRTVAGPGRAWAVQGGSRGGWLGRHWYRSPPLMSALPLRQRLGG